MAIHPGILDLPHVLVEWVTTLVVTVRATGAASSARLSVAMVALVYLHEHTTLRRSQLVWGSASPPIKRRPLQELTLTEKTVNRVLAAARAPVECGVARLKSWRIFRRSGCSPTRMTSIAKAVLILEQQR